MYGLPGQTNRDLEATLNRSTALGADRIALFGYAHVPQLIPRQRRIDGSALPDQHARFGMAAIGHQILVEAGYTPVGFDHFALPGDPLAHAAMSGQLHRNFQGFTDDAASVVIGLGASAISSFPTLLAQNEKNTGRYRMMMSQDRFSIVCGTRRSRDDQLRSDIIERLLCDGHPGRCRLPARAVYRPGRSENRRQPRELGKRRTALCTGDRCDLRCLSRRIDRPFLLRRLTQTRPAARKRSPSFGILRISGVPAPFDSVCDQQNGGTSRV